MQTEKHFALLLLLDIYGPLLTQKQQEALDMYLNKDLSLSEIAENTGISRQAAQDSIKNAEQRLQEWEAVLGICRKRQQIEAVLQQMQPDAGSMEAGIEQIRKILWEE